MNRFSILVTIILLGLPDCGFSQNISGRVVDSDTQMPLPYVNIGVVYGDRGTVSDEEGYFSLDLTGADSAATLRFSFIGYEPHDMSVSEARGQGEQKIRLHPKVLELKEVVVFAREYGEKIVGNPKPLKFAVAGFRNDSLGYEVGIRVKIRQRPTMLKQLRLHGLTTSYDTVFYRLNVYELEDGNPGKNILKEPIYITLTDNEKTRDRDIDLTPYHIMVQDDFVISLEYVRDMGEGSLTLNTGMLSGKTFFRRTSQGKWYSAPLGYGMSVLIRYQK